MTIYLLSHDITTIITQSIFQPGTLFARATDGTAAAVTAAAVTAAAAATAAAVTAATDGTAAAAASGYHLISWPPYIKQYFFIRLDVLQLIG